MVIEFQSPRRSRRIASAQLELQVWLQLAVVSSCCVGMGYNKWYLLLQRIQTSRLLVLHILFVEAAPASITLGTLPYNSLTTETVNAYLPRPAAHRVTEQRPTGEVSLRLELEARR